MFPHLGHMTSIGRLLVVISIGEPQLRQVTVIGDVAGAWTSSDGDGPEGAFGARIPPIPLNMPFRHMSKVMMTTQIRMMSSSTGMSPTVTNCSGFVARIVTTSEALAPVRASVIVKAWSPSFMPCGTVYTRSPVDELVDRT
ncbi:MAG TPA: hypothetical protein VEM95_03705 [Thermoplasmata archaeon]|nr:hypothetical protein [Thermoplasmata archaeon]